MLQFIVKFVGGLEKTSLFTYKVVKSRLRPWRGGVPVGRVKAAASYIQPYPNRPAQPGEHRPDRVTPVSD